MESELPLYGLRAASCIHELVLLAAAACAAVVAVRAKSTGIKAVGPGLLAGCLVVSAVVGFTFAILDWVGLDPDVFYPLAVATSGIEALVALVFIVGLALLGRTPMGVAR